MNEYKSLDKYLKKKESHNKVSTFFKKLFSKILCVIILVLVMLIILKMDKNNNGQITNFLKSNNINFASINESFKKYVGELFPSIKENEVPVFNEKLE